MSARLPNAFIGGAQKAGTTSLHRLLESHPGAFTPPDRQEIHFFDVEENYRRGLDWYASLFSEWQGEPVVFQTSPLYLYEPAVPERIAGACPDARFVFILRHPVDRAYSHYRHEIRFGREHLSFEAALEREPERIARGFDARRQYSYLDRGRYAGQLARYVERFGRERVLVLLTDDLAAAPEQVAEALARHLELPWEDWAWRVRGRRWHRNRNRVPRIPAVQRLTSPVRRSLPWLAMAVDLVNLREVRYPPMDPATRNRLQAEIAPELDALEALTGLDLSRWRQG